MYGEEVCGVVVVVCGGGERWREVEREVCGTVDREGRREVSYIMREGRFVDMMN